MNKITVVMAHIGRAALPTHLGESLECLDLVSDQYNFLFIGDESNKQKFQDLLLIRAPRLASRAIYVSTESIKKSQITLEFIKLSKLNRNFRQGFWFNASFRFYLIADYMAQSGLENCLHIENDVVLYFDPTVMLDSFMQFSQFAVPLDNVRAIPGIVWIQNKHIAQQLIRFMLSQKDLDDMATLGRFTTNHPSIAKALPTMPSNYAVAKNLDLSRYCAGIELFGGVFDGAAIGQYIGGGHWLNNPEDTRFYLNECSDLNLSHIGFSWESDQIGRVPYLTFQGISTRVLSIHAHSKDLLGIAPSNTMTKIPSKEFITGERIQSLADISITTRRIDAFHAFPNQQGMRLIKIPEKKVLKVFNKKEEELLPVDEGFIEICEKVKIIFLYTHLLPYFQKYILNRLKSPFVLITHNSDVSVTIEYLEILNKTNLIMWFAQNAVVSHAKLAALPIGLANLQWGEEKISCLANAASQAAKTKLIYLNFNTGTHPDRVLAHKELQQFNFITIGKNLLFQDYVKDLANHKFCICPRGNGIDTHRFWEAQYVDCIPVILESDWIAAYSGLPILIVKSWTDLNETMLEKAYVRISTTSHDRTLATVTNIKNNIMRVLDTESQRR